jgi:hypothetical protein
MVEVVAVLGLKVLTTETVVQALHHQFLEP